MNATQPLYDLNAKNREELNANALANRLILITRPEPGASETARLVASYGGIPLLAPVLRVVPVADPAPFANAMTKLDTFDGVLLTSANSARIFAAAMPVDTKPPPLFAVGKKTARILEQKGWEVTLPTQPEGGETLGRTLLEWHPHGKRFLFPRAEEGREELITLLQQANKEVITIPVYRSEPVSCLPAGILTKVDVILFYSPRTVEVFLDLAQESIPDQVILAALSPLTAQSLIQRQKRVDIIATRPDNEGMLEALILFLNHTKNPRQQ